MAGTEAGSRLRFVLARKGSTMSMLASAQTTMLRLAIADAEGAAA